MTGKVPRRPPHHLIRADGDVVEAQPVLWRVHRTQGEHVLPWDGFRTFGPVSSGRYDPHPPPAQEHPGYGVLYAATDLRTALAEVFQRTRRINLTTGAPYAIAWTPTRPLRLLDLTGDWALRNRAAHSLAFAPRPTCRAWARAVHATWGNLDGLWAPSTLTSEPIVTLYEPAASAVPSAPAFSRPFDHPVLASLARHYAATLAYDIG